MHNPKKTWIWQQSDWPRFHWQKKIIQPLLRALRLKQGILLGKTGTIDQNINLESTLDTFLQNIMASSAIEEEQLNAQSVRFSLAKRIGLRLTEPYTTTKRSEGLAEIMLDATYNSHMPLSLERILQWHIWLFPEDIYSFLHPVKAGQFRGEGSISVSKRIDKTAALYEAPPKSLLTDELKLFIEWFNHSLKESLLDPLLRAAICHLWFITLHPFEDGNGQITRVLTDLALAQDDNQSIHLYAMSITLLADRQNYDAILEKSRRNTTDITEWIVWFLKTLDKSMQIAIDKIDLIFTKTRFWRAFQEKGLSKEQIKILNLMLEESENLEQGINASQYKKITKTSKATATRHLTDLLAKGCIEKLPGGGRSTRYQIHQSFIKKII